MTVSGPRHHSIVSSSFADYIFLHDLAFRRRAHALPTIPHIGSKLETLGISKEMLKPLASAFYRDLVAGKIKGCDKDSVKSVHGLEDRRNLDSYLYTHFLEYAEPHLPKDIVSKLASLKKITDLRFPHEWYPEARRMQRYEMLSSILLTT